VLEKFAIEVLVFDKHGSTRISQGPQPNSGSIRDLSPGV